MNELIYGFYAFAYYANDYVLKIISNPFHRSVFEILAPFVILQCILVINRVITAKQLVLLSILYCCMPVIMKKILFGSITPFNIGWLDRSDFFIIGLSLSLGSILQLIYLTGRVFFEGSWKFTNNKWIGGGLLSWSFLLILPSSTTMFAFVYMSPNLLFKPENAFQWYGELLAGQTILLLLAVTIPALCGVVPLTRNYKIPHFALNLLLVALLIYNLKWSLNYAFSQI